MKKLCEIALVNPKQTETLKDDEIVSFVPMSAVKAETASVESEENRRYSEVRKGYTSFRKNDVLIAKITPCFENGKIVQANLSHPVGFGSTEFHVVRPIAGKSDARYLLHYLRQNKVRRDGKRKMTGSAGQKRWTAPYLLDSLAKN